MFFVDLPEKEDVEDEDEDEIDKSIKEIHQSAQKLSDSIVHVAGNNKTLADNDDKLNAISATFKGKVFHFLCNFMIYCTVSLFAFALILLLDYYIMSYPFLTI